MKKLLMSVAALFMGLSMVAAQGAYTKVTSADELVEDGVYLIATAEYGMALAMNFTNNAAREAAAVNIAGGVISTTVATSSSDQLPYEIALKKNGENWSLYDLVNQQYIARTTADENKIQLQADAYEWKITIDADGNADIVSLETTPRRILYNSNTGQERFSGYKAVNTTNKAVQLYKSGGTYVDETAPEVSYVVTAAATPTSVEVHFSETLEKESAETAANYTFNNDLTVSAAALGEDNKTVTLTTSAMTEGTAYELTVNGVKDAAGNATDNLKYTFTFGAIEVDDIAAVLALRDNYVEAQQYRIKGEVVVVAHVGTSIYVQDKGCETTKGHSIMLYDQPKTYADKFPAGTVLKNVAGSLTIYQNALLEMQYLADNITDNGTADVVVTKATIAEVYKDNLYHAALVQFSDVEFDNVGQTFEAKGGDGSGNYRMDDPTGYMSLHIYSSDNIVGEKVPEGKCTVTGYVGVYNGTSQLILRDKSDIVANGGSGTANDATDAVAFRAYPNPTGGMFTLDVEDNNYNVRVYTVSGMEVMNLKALNGKTQINLEGMAKGVYVVEIATANGTSRAKVVLR